MTFTLPTAEPKPWVIGVTIKSRPTIARFAIKPPPIAVTTKNIFAIVQSIIVPTQSTEPAVGVTINAPRTLDESRPLEQVAQLLRKVQVADPTRKIGRNRRKIDRISKESTGVRMDGTRGTRCLVAASDGQ
jgi:hypothetical protein